MGRTKKTEHHETILVAQDSAAERERIARILEEEGYRIYVATSGNDALEIWKVVSAEIGLVLVDVKLAGIPGTELADVLRALSPKLKVILTGSEAEADEAHLSAAQRRHLLDKPIRKPELIEAIEKALGEK